MSRPRSYLVFDIETVPDGSLWPRLEATSGARTEAGNGSRTAVTAEVVAAEHGHNGRHGAKADRDSSFPPAYAHVAIVIGGLWLDEDYRLRELRIIGEGQDESGILAEFSRFVGRHRPALVTYNGRAFDLPVIALRSLRHGVAMPWYYQDSGLRYRYSLEDHIDLCDWLADHGATRSGSLDALAKLIGLPGKLGIDGSQVEGLYRDGQLEHIQNYCLADVVQTALLFLRFRLLQGVLDRDRYRAIVADLTTQLSGDARLREFMEAVDGDRLLAA